MAKLLSLVGRAASFVLKALKGEHFIVHDCKSVPALLKSMSEQLRQKGTLSYRVNDIESCYTMMPKTAMRLAMRDILAQVKASLPPGAGTDPAILVPTRSKKRCAWAHSSRRDAYGHAKVSFSLILDVIEFDLENCYVATHDGRLLKQTGGIPMGSALSPALCNGTLAWMEQKWMEGLTPHMKARFRMGRYMDDVLTVVAHDDQEWTADTLLNDFESSTCYWSPLKLERADESCFLETRIVELTQDGRFTHRLKNANEGRASSPAVWRYQRWDSFGSESAKIGVLIGCLRKVEWMASDERRFHEGLAYKMQEFQALGYPRRVLQAACERMYESVSGGWRWLRAASLFDESLED